MINTNLLVNIAYELTRWAKSTEQATESLKRFAKLLEDRDKFHAIYEGQWPDRFVLLNRFVRTGQRPPFIINT